MDQRFSKSELTGLQQTIRLFETLLKNSIDGILVTDVNQNIVLVSQSFCDYFERDRLDMMETNLFTWLSKLGIDAPSRWAELEQDVTTNGTCKNVGFQKLNDGKTQFLSVDASRLDEVGDNEGSVLLSVWHDVTPQTELENRLRLDGENLDRQVKERTDQLNRINEQLSQEIIAHKHLQKVQQATEERYRKVADFTYDWEYWIDPQGEYIYVSPSCERITGYGADEFTRNPGLLIEIMHPEDRLLFADHEHEVSEMGELDPINFRITTRMGTERWIGHVCQSVTDANGNYAGKRGSNRDITQRKNMEEELLNAEKLKSVGSLAAGIAHDLNNLLTGIIGNLSLARESDNPADKDKHLEIAEDISLQVTDLSQRLLTYATGGLPILQEMDISTFLRDSTVSSLSKSNVHCDFSLPGNLWPVKADERQLNQVIRNLVLNAEQAMPEGGALRLSAQNIELDNTYNGDLKSGSYVMVTFEDSGVGIPKENQHKVFDPFFSTKEVSIGLGLTTTKSIIQKHKGQITLDSQLGVGSTFTLYLPVEADEIPVQKKWQEAESVEGPGRILLMDDEAAIREVVNISLNKLGYTVTTSKDGTETLKKYNDSMSSGHPFDAVILDLTIRGGMGGQETIKRIKEINPEVRAIVASGYSDDPVMTNYRDYGFKGVISKPFRLAELSAILAEVIKGD